MTHPDILKMERDGYIGSFEESTGKCDFCGEYIYKDNEEAVESTDYEFCCIECCHKYYGIRRIVEC